MAGYLKIWEEHAKLREGVVYKVYLDSLGKPTAGIGHLLTKTELEIFNVGDDVSEEQVITWFERDSAIATAAAKKQARQIGVETDWFIAALISVNFQLGSKWTVKFKTTWPAIVNHDFDTAITNLRKSLWYRQTPVRVEDFIQALERAKRYLDRPVAKTRTAKGSAGSLVGVGGLAAAEPLQEAANSIEPLTEYSEYIKWIFVAISLVSIGLILYARIDDRKEGLR